MGLSITGGKSVRRPSVARRKRKKRIFLEVGQRAREGSGGYLRWFLGQQRFLGGGSIVTWLSYAIGKAYKKSPQCTGPHPERVASILASEGHGSAGLAEGDRRISQLGEVCRKDRKCPWSTRWDVCEQAGFWRGPCSVGIWVRLIHSE